MTKLTDLAEHELANLLGLSLDKARRWLEVARSIAEADEPPEPEDIFGELEPVPFLQRSSVAELMGISVEEVERLKRTGEFYRCFPSFRRKAPKDAVARLRHLRDLLADEVEFEARYPAAWALLCDQPEASSGLPLPSFDARVLAPPTGVRVLRNDPQASILPAGWFQTWKSSQDSGDAFSLTVERRSQEDKEADQSFSPLEIGHMRGVLLAIMSREEYAERIATDLHNEAVREGLRAPAQSQVRLTDLRLATAPWLQNQGCIEKSLRPLLASLGNPVTPQRIVGWKTDLLRREGGAGGEGSDEADAKIARVSFAAAALTLFVDLGMPGIEDAHHSTLARQVANLAGILQKVSKSLNANANKLEKLVSYRDPNRPATPDQKVYDALVEYRMGAEPKLVAEHLGLKPYKSSPSKQGANDEGGTRDWKNKLAERLERGAEVERRKYPLVSAVFENRHKPRITHKALLAYGGYLKGKELSSDESDESLWAWAGDKVNVDASTAWGRQVVKAYVQLGSCLERRLDPFPTRPDLDA